MEWCGFHWLFLPFGRQDVYCISEGMILKAVTELTKGNQHMSTDTKATETKKDEDKGTTKGGCGCGHSH
jgi:hypothetical protein